jgi:hypothetical protein
VAWQSTVGAPFSATWFTVSLTSQYVTSQGGVKSILNAPAGTLLLRPLATDPTSTVVGALC